MLIPDVSMTALVSSVYGALSGIFIGRTLALWRTTKTRNATPLEPTGVAWG